MDAETAQTIEPSKTTETNETSKRSLSLLASEFFPNDFKGEVKQEETKLTETTEDNSEKTEVVTEENTEEKTEVVTDTQEDEIPISSITELVEHYELDGEWFNGLNMPVKVDGESSDVQLSELVKSYQMNQAADKRLDEAKSKAKAINQGLAQKSEALQEQFAAAGKLIESAEGILDQDVKAIDWAKLRDDDPAEYSAKKTDIADRRNRIDQLKNDAVIAYRDAVVKQSESDSTALQEKLVVEQQEMLDKIPEWKDPEKAKTESAKLTEYLVKQGFSQQDIESAYDHRLIVLSRKAMLFDEVANSDATKKRVSKVPKVLKPGISKTQDQTNQEKVRKAHVKLRNSGKLDDAFRLLKARRGSQ